MADIEAAEPQAKQMTAAGRYEMLVPERSPFLDRARRFSTLTIPGLIPPEGQQAGELPTPYQSIAADGVNNLSAKILQVLFPAGQGFFRLTMDDFVIEDLNKRAVASGTDPEEARAEFEDALSKVERAVINRMEQKGNRTQNFEAIQHMIVGGNALIYVRPDGSEQFFPLAQYVVKRDLDGNVLEIVVKESLARIALPPRIQEILRPSSQDQDKEKNVDLFTWVKRTDTGSWKVHQEVEGRIVPGSEGTYPKGKCAWIALRWRSVPSEDYGRGRVEEYFGDTVSAEMLSKAIVEFAAQASKVNWLVDESGQTDKDTVAKAPNGAVYHGRADDVSVLMLEKAQDFQIANAVLEKVERRLEKAFLTTASIQRNAERVTAEEIRAMIQELEQGLGGVYALLSEEFQRPIATRILHQMMVAHDLPFLPEDVVSPQIVTGKDGLSRQSDLQKLDTFLAGVSELFGPEAVVERVNVSEYIKRRGAALGIDMSGLVKSEEEVAQAQAQAQRQQMTEKLGPAGIKAATDIALNGQQTS